jgi:anti-anti-sigma factor
VLIEIESQPDVCILRLIGRFVMATDPEYLRSKTETIKAGGHVKLLADLSGVLSICSTEIGFLVDLYTSTTKKSGGRFILAGANARIQEVLNLTRLNTVIPQAPDIASGLAVLRI